MKGVELDKAAVFARIKYVPHPGQARVHASKAKRRVVCAGTRWGKSEAAAAETVCAVLEPREKALIWTVAPTLDLTERVFNRVVYWLETGFKHRIISYDKRERTIVVRNLGGGVTTLRAKSTDAPAGLLGESLDMLVVDECVRIPTNVWHRYLAARLIDRHGGAFLISTAGSVGWFYDEWKRGQKKRDPEYESWSAPTIENPHIDPTTVEAQKGRMPGDLFKVEYLGEFKDVPIEPCDRCGGPDPKVSGTVIIDLDKGETLAHCEECGNAIDETGHTLVGLWPNGQAHLLVIQGMARPDRVPEFPLEVDLHPNVAGLAPK